MQTAQHRAPSGYLEWTRPTFDLPTQPLKLPRGRVEVVYVVDEKKRPGGREWRISFDYDTISRDIRGQPMPDRLWKPRVMHVLTVLNAILTELGKAKCRPVFVGKAFDDRMTVVLWERPSNPLVAGLEVAGWRVEWFAIKDGQQCAMGFDPKLAVLEDLGDWPK